MLLCACEKCGKRVALALELAHFELLEDPPRCPWHAESYQLRPLKLPDDPFLAYLEIALESALGELDDAKFEGEGDALAQLRTQQTASTVRVALDLVRLKLAGEE